MYIRYHHLVNFEAGTKEVLALLLGEGKEFVRMVPVVKERFIATIDRIEVAESLEDIGVYRSFNLKFFKGTYQINVTPEKRMRFTVEGDTVVVTFFGSTSHKGE
jgi:hypothetical protein